jgi:hypothetical protein
MTDLLRAASYGNWESATKIIRHRADPSVAEDQGLTYRSKELTRTLIELGPAGLVFNESVLAGLSTTLFFSCALGP